MPQYLDTWSQTRKLGKLSIGQRVALLLMPKKNTITLISGLEPTGLARGVDTSHWNGDIDVARMKAEGDVSIVFPKASDGKQMIAGDPYNIKNYVDDWLDRTVQKCYDARVACGPYHYVQPYLDPNYTVKGTADHNINAIHAAMDHLVPKKSYHLFNLDVEEKSTSDPNCSDVVLKIIEHIEHDANLSQVPWMIYWSSSIFNYYIKLREQLSFKGANRNMWMAQWVYTKGTNTSWTDMIANILPKLSMKVITPGYANWKFLQWSASITLPGCSGALDQDLYVGSKAQLYAWLGFNAGDDTTPPPPPPPEGDIEARVGAVEARATILEQRMDTNKAKFGEMA